MAFDLYFAGSQCPESTDLIEQNGYCRLHSYYGDKTAIKRRFERNPEGKLFIDSGAFTAWTRGAKIDVDEESELASEYRISSIPTLVLLKNGKPVDSAIGYRPANFLVEMINKQKN